MKYLIFTLFFVLIPISADAEDFDPNFVLSDEDLIAHNTMTRGDVHIFLNSKGGQLSNQYFRDTDRYQRSAADIIFNAAQKHKINPRVLLVMLQKEQSLITDQKPKITQFDWAMGYGVCDACSVDTSLVAKHKGFATQVDSAAGSLRYYLDQYKIQKWIKRAGQTYTISGITVTPVSNATGFLYTYTPHIEGNKNFRTIWRNWFEKTYPDGLILKAPNSPDIWYLQNGQRRRIASMNVLNSYFNPSEIRIADALDILNIPKGPAMQFTNYALIRSNHRTYLLVDSELLQFASDESLRSLGFNPEEIIDAEPEELTQFTRGTMLTSASEYPTGAILQARTSNDLYYVKNGYRHPILDKKILASNFKNDPPILVNDTGLEAYLPNNPILFDNGSLIGLKGTPHIYLISNEQRRHIQNEQTFNQLNFDFSDVYWIDEPLFNLHSKGKALN